MMNDRMALEGMEHFLDEVSLEEFEAMSDEERQRRGAVLLKRADVRRIEILGESRDVPNPYAKILDIRLPSSQIVRGHRACERIVL